MLKAYKVYTYITVDNKYKYEPLRYSIGLTDDFKPKVTTQTYTFQELIDNNAEGIDYVITGKTFFLKIPYIKIQHWPEDGFHYNFDSITIEKHYVPWNITMNELFEDFSADQCIQYLKDRGITACPILK
jgi:hypothetical protein